MYFSSAFTFGEKVQIFFYDLKKASKRVHCAASEEILKDLNGKDREYVENVLGEIKNGKCKDDKISARDRKILIEIIENRLAEMENPTEPEDAEKLAEEIKAQMEKNKEKEKKSKKNSKEEKAENESKKEEETSEEETKEETKEEPKEEKKEEELELVEAEIVDNPTSAASTCGPRVEDAPVGVDFSGLGGFPVENGFYNERTKRIEPDYIKQEVVPNPAVQPPVWTPDMSQMTQPMPPQQYQQIVNPTATNVPNFGMHKVDNPIKPKPPVPEKAREDSAETEGLEKINVETEGSGEPELHPNEAIQNPIPQVKPEDAYVPLNPVFDNSKLTSMPNRQYLAKIEEIGLNCGYQIQMVENETTKLIYCYVFADGSNKPSPNKSFTIDPGMICDARAKMYPFVAAEGYENFNPYPVLIPVKDKNAKSKSKNEFNKKLFEGMIVGGADNIANQRQMFRNDIFELNKFMAVITIPRKNMDAETRKKIEDRLIAAMKAGVFNAARQYDPKARFRVKDNSFNKKNNTFTLTTKGMRPAFGSNELCNVLIEIDFGTGGETKVTKITA